MLKPELYQPIKNNKKRYLKYKFDVLLAEYGHTVLRLPPYHPDLNPIEKIWATVKNNTANRNTTFKLDDVKNIVEEEFAKIGSEEWVKRCQHAIKIEGQYMEKEIVIARLRSSIQ